MRIVAGAWRGRTLIAPPGQGTRPTADRVRQALFDMLMHAAWGGRGVIEGALVLDVFAGTGALGLEALSRGAASACFIERDGVALRALRANVAACKAGERAVVLAMDVFAPSSAVNAGLFGAQQQRLAAESGPFVAENRRTDVGTAGKSGEFPSLVFLDPPYGQDLIPRALDSLRDAGWIGPNALVVAETGRDDAWVPAQPLLAERDHGPARILIFRSG